MVGIYKGQGGAYKAASFIGAPLTMVTIWTVADIAVTGVESPLADFKAANGLASGTNISTLTADRRTFNGSAIADDTAYTTAYAQQQNLDKLLKTLSTLGAPVAVSTITSLTSATSPSTYATYPGSTSGGRMGSSVSTASGKIQSVGVLFDKDTLATQAAIESLLNGATFISSSSANDTLAAIVAGTSVGVGSTYAMVTKADANATTRQGLVVAATSTLTLAVPA